MKNNRWLMVLLASLFFFNAFGQTTINVHTENGATWFYRILDVTACGSMGCWSSDTLGNIIRTSKISYSKYRLIKFDNGMFYVVDTTIVDNGNLDAFNEKCYLFLNSKIHSVAGSKANPSELTIPIQNYDNLPYGSDTLLYSSPFNAFSGPLYSINCGIIYQRTGFISPNSGGHEAIVELLKRNGAAIDISAIRHYIDAKSATVNSPARTFNQRTISNSSKEILLKPSFHNDKGYSLLGRNLVKSRNNFWITSGRHSKQSSPHERP